MAFTEENLGKELRETCFASLFVQLTPPAAPPVVLVDTDLWILYASGFTACHEP